MLKKKNTSLIYFLLAISAIISILFILIIGVVWYQAIDKSYTKSINEIKTRYTENEKIKVQQTVNNIIKDINDDRQYIIQENRDISFKEFISIYNSLSFYYKLSKDILSKDSISLMIKNILEDETFKNDSLSYYIFDYQGNCILNPYRHELEGKNLLYLKDKNNKHIIKTLINKAKNGYSGEIIQNWPYNWSNLNKDSIQRKGASFFRVFEPLKWIIVARLDFGQIENKLQMKWLRKLSLYRYGKNNHGYVFVIKLTNINGSSCFGKMLINASNPKIAGKCLSDDYKDIKGFQFRKVFLKDLRQKGFSFVKYHYYVPNSDRIESKISYFKLYKPWSWIIATGVYLPDLKAIIAQKQKEKICELKKARRTIFSIIAVMILIFISMPYFISHIIDKKIDDVFKDFEDALDKNRFINVDKYKFKQVTIIASHFNKAIRRFRDYENKFVETFVNIIEARDLYTKGHSQRVAMYAQAMAKALSLDEEHQTAIYKAGLLHDIGKIGIPDNILLKPGRLSENEYEIIKYHSLFSYELLKRIEHFKDLAEPVKHHHEKCDGSGYPDGLTCKELCIEARILAIADIFDALTTTRPYRKAFTPQKAIEILKKEKIDQDILNKTEKILISSFKAEEQTEAIFMSETIDKIRNNIFTVDYMTGLLFITEFINRTKQCIKNNKRFVVYRLNIKGLSRINYEFSTDVGNSLILYTAKVLKDIVGKHQEVLLARAYADVFLVAYEISDQTSIEDIEKILSKEKIIKLVKKMVKYDENISTSNNESLLNYIDIAISYAIYPDEGSYIEEIIYKTEKKMKEQDI